MLDALDAVLRATGGVWVAHGSGAGDRRNSDARGRLAVPGWLRGYGLAQLRPDSALLTMTYLGGERVVPNYNMMGIAKAALDAIAKAHGATQTGSNTRFTVRPGGAGLVTHF